MGWLKVLSLVLALTVVLNLSAVRSGAAPPDDDFRIVPGERIGPYRLGGPHSFFAETWGDNDLGAGRERQHCPGQKYAWTVKPMGYIAEFWKDRAVKVGVYSSAHPYYPERDPLASKYRTDKGVQLGSTYAEVRRGYGNPQQEGRTTGSTYWYYRIGMRLLLSRAGGDGKATQIDVVPPGTVLTEQGMLPCPPVPDR